MGAFDSTAPRSASTASTAPGLSDVRASPGLSLKARALKYLAQREHSRLELQRKLGPHAESADQIQCVLDQLEAANLFSEKRFVESLMQRRSARFGTRRIAHELDQHRIGQDDRAVVMATLKHTERDRALEVWRRKFGVPPQDLSERARQHRFLAQRGFTSDAIAWVLKQGPALDEA